MGSLVYTISDVTDRDIDEADNSLTYTISKDLEEVSFVDNKLNCNFYKRKINMQRPF